MIALYIILPLALLIASTAVLAFVWVVRSGQLDDVDTPPRRILFEDVAPASTETHRRRAIDRPRTRRPPR
jgi:cbb3-type cytochrome oxidase maturation protein